MYDQINDMITRIRNGQKVGLKEINLFKPTSKLCIKILYLLRKEGFISNYKINNLYSLEISVKLKFNTIGKPAITTINTISKPGKRIFIKNKNLWNIKSGQGIFILSTPKGLVTHLEAKMLNCGGELLVAVF